MEDHARVLSGGHKCLVGVEAVAHALLKLGEREIFGSDGGHFKSPGVDGAVFFLGEDGLNAGRGAVGAAEGSGELGEEEVADRWDDGGLDEAHGVLVFGDEGVDEVDGSFGVAFFNGA